MQSKYFISYPVTGNIFNCLTEKYDRPVTVFQARPQPFDTCQQAEQFLSEEIFEESIMGVVSVAQGAVIMKIEADENGDYALPVFNNTLQVQFINHRF